MLPADRDVPGIHIDIYTVLVYVYSTAPKYVLAVSSKSTLLILYIHNIHVHCSIHYIHYIRFTDLFILYVFIKVAYCSTLARAPK